MPKGGRRIRIFSALEVANICGVVNQTTINWIRNGHLKAFTTPGGQYRIYAKDLAAFLDNRGMETSGELLQVMMENANWDCILIGAPQSVNRDLSKEIQAIYSDVSISQAYNWFEIGRKITEEKPGLIFIDVDLQGGDIYNFISTVKEDITYGKPHLVLLSKKRKVDPNLSSMADNILFLPLESNELKTILKTLEKQQAIA